jgi:predicted HAD superfamily Cof-like phosphohydrolase
MNSQFSAVCDFMKMCSQDVLTTPSEPSTKLANLRYSLIDEEVSELTAALDADDIIEIADAFADILYVVYGAFAAFGLECNLSVPTSTSDGSVVYAPRIRTATAMKAQFKASLTDLTNSFSGIADGYSTPLTEFITGVFSWAKTLNLDIISCFDEVHRSNMSKACKTQEDANKSIALRVKTNADYTDATVQEINELFVIKRKVDGKVLKGCDYFDPDLSKYIKLA